MPKGKSAPVIDVSVVANGLSAHASGSVTTYHVRRIETSSVDETDDLVPNICTPLMPEKRAARQPRRSRTEIQEKKSPRLRGSETKKVRYRGRETYCGDVPMTRLRYKLVAGDSLLECDFVIVTDATEDDLIDVQSQPAPLAIYVEGHELKWTPDYLIRRVGFTAELVEVKNLSWLRPSDPSLAAYRRAWVDACAVARSQGFTFRLLTEQEIRVEPRLSNAYLTHRHLGPFVDEGLLMKAVMALPSLMAQATVADLGSAIDNPLRAIECAIRLDRQGYIRLDRSTVFSSASTFTNSQAEREPQ